MPLPESPEQYIPQQRQRHMIRNLDVDEASVQQLITLPTLHNDPFDRLLISQAIQHELTLATVDSRVLAYPVNFL